MRVSHGRSSGNRHRERWEVELSAAHIYRAFCLSFSLSVFGPSPLTAGFKSSLEERGRVAVESGEGERSDDGAVPRARRPRRERARRRVDAVLAHAPRLVPNEARLLGRHRHAGLDHLVRRRIVVGRLADVPLRQRRIDCEEVRPAGRILAREADVVGEAMASRLQYQLVERARAVLVGVGDLVRHPAIGRAEGRVSICALAGDDRQAQLPRGGVAVGVLVQARHGLAEDQGERRTPTAAGDEEEQQQEGETRERRRRNGRHPDTTADVQMSAPAESQLWASKEETSGPAACESLGVGARSPFSC